jgi:hypothetical protein
METRLTRINNILDTISESIGLIDEARKRLTPEEAKAAQAADNAKRKAQMRAKAAEKKAAGVPAKPPVRFTAKPAAAPEAAPASKGPRKFLTPEEIKARQEAANAKRKGQMRAKAQDAIAQRWAGAEPGIRAAALRAKDDQYVIPAKGGVSQADKIQNVHQRLKGAIAPAGPASVDAAVHKHTPLYNATKLMGMQLNRKRDPRGVNPDEKRWAGPGTHQQPTIRDTKLRKDPDVKSPDWKGHSLDKAAGKVVHAKGGKENKKFANNTTFRATPDDAMLHTDQSLSGSRAEAGDSEFAFTGDTDADPRQKWYRVSKEGGYPSAMASLNKIYHKPQKMRAKVIEKVKATTFPGAKGQMIKAEPTGALHTERPVCKTDKHGSMHPEGIRLKNNDPGEYYRLCKGAHGPSGTPDRDEYQSGFEPKHDDPHKLHRLHKAALLHKGEGGKADKPTANIQAHHGTHKERAAEMANPGLAITARKTRQHGLEGTVGSMIGQSVKSRVGLTKAKIRKMGPEKSQKKMPGARAFWNKRGAEGRP